MTAADTTTFPTRVSYEGMTDQEVVDRVRSIIASDEAKEAHDLSLLPHW